MLSTLSDKLGEDVLGRCLRVDVPGSGRDQALQSPVALAHRAGAFDGPVRHVQRRRRTVAGGGPKILGRYASCPVVEVKAAGLGDQGENTLGHRVAADDGDVVELLALRYDELAHPRSRIGQLLDRRGRRDLGAQLVVARLDRGQRGIARGRGDEHPDIGDDVPVHQVLGNHRSRIARIDLDDDVLLALADEIAGRFRSAEELGAEQPRPERDCQYQPHQNCGPATPTVAAPVLAGSQTRRADSLRLSPMIGLSPIRLGPIRLGPIGLQIFGHRHSLRVMAALRRWSSQPCKIVTAATWSIIPRCSLARTPASRSARAALTVVNRSSASRTGTGPMCWPMASATSIASAADDPARSARVRGKPTTTSTTSISTTSAAIRRRYARPRSRRTVSTGVASTASGSLTATPIRTVPTSIPSLRPRPGSSIPGRSGRRFCTGMGGRQPPANSARTAASAASIPAGLVPEPCAKSAFPPPRPPTAAATAPTRSPARTPPS